MRTTALLLLTIAAAPVVAQTATPATTKTMATKAGSAVADIRSHWRTMSGYVLQSAVDVPEAKYAFKPTPEVRSFGELIAHVAGAQSMFCAMALGEKAPPEDAVSAKSKADLIAAMKQSNQNCERAYAQSDASVSANVDVFGEQHTRLYALMMNATHDAEHYGNIITYMRINGMVPPSSKR
ncbi:MAG: DinB family protein [Gemmatimonadota bacterium]